MEKFAGPLDISLNDLPSIKLKTYKSEKNTSVWQRLAIATVRRHFTLVEDWHLNVDQVEFNPALNGTIHIPVKDQSGESIEYDGASVPAPWLISLLTIGILRPLGIMLVGSIVHDYAFKYGHLRYTVDGNDSVEVPVSREDADMLFRQILRTVNNVPVVGFAAWLFVRIGWFFGIRYKGERFGGKPPFKVLGIVVAILGFLVWLGCSLGESNLWKIIAGLYTLSYAASLYLNRSGKTMNEDH